MATVDKGATLTPTFREFLPTWLARQAWYLGSGVPTLKPIGFFRFEDPAGEVGIETHLATDGAEIYQIPMTYRPSRLDGLDAALITTAEHSVLGTRWIYNGPADPVWQTELLNLVRTGGANEPSSRQDVGPAVVRGHLLRPDELSAEGIEVLRVLSVNGLADESGLAGLVTGTWYPDGAEAPAVSGWLTKVHRVPFHRLPFAG